MNSPFHFYSIRLWSHERSDVNLTLQSSRALGAKEVQRIVIESAKEVLEEKHIRIPKATGEIFRKGKLRRMLIEKLEGYGLFDVKYDAVVDVFDSKDIGKGRHGAANTFDLELQKELSEIICDRMKFHSRN